MVYLATWLLISGDVCVVAIDQRILVQSFSSTADSKIPPRTKVLAQLDPDNNINILETYG